MKTLEIAQKMGAVRCEDNLSNYGLSDQKIFIGYREEYLHKNLLESFFSGGSGDEVTDESWFKMAKYLESMEETSLKGSTFPELEVDVIAIEERNGFKLKVSDFTLDQDPQSHQQYAVCGFHIECWEWNEEDGEVGLISSFSVAKDSENNIYINFTDDELYFMFEGGVAEGTEKDLPEYGKEGRDYVEIEDGKYLII